MEDARKDESLIGALNTLGHTTTVAEFLASVPVMTPEKKQCSIDQAMVLIDQVYTHLPLKRSMHAVDPVQNLKLLRHRLDKLSDHAFHAGMIEIFKGLRDAHTNYGLPQPYAGHLAFLPFLLQAFYESGKRCFMVTHLLFNFSHPTFKRGAVVTHWNGMPTEVAVQANADREEGSNPAARFAFGLRAMTIRDLGSSLPPDEEWVVVGYLDEAGADHEIILPWRVWDFAHDPRPDLGDIGMGKLTPERLALGIRMKPGLGDTGVVRLSPRRLALGISVRSQRDHRARKILFAHQAMEAEKRLVKAQKAVAAAARKIGDWDLADLDLHGADPDKESTLPNVFEFRKIQSGGKEYGYIGIWTFNHDVGEFLNEFLRILQLMPRDGLILDVRGNGGGLIWNAEIMLQFLTPKNITPEPFCFINTPLTREICTKPVGLPTGVTEARAGLEAEWGASITQSVETGAVFSRGVPLTPENLCNAFGQSYHGPVVLITDAECFSATDIFAAGFQDHGIGKVIGVDDNTGAGGANVWTHEDLLELLPGEDSPVQALPEGTTMRVAIRRCTRVGPRLGQPVEDLGVNPDTRHNLTRNDLVNNYEDLYSTAISILAAEKCRQLDVKTGNVAGGELQLTVHTLNLDRLDIHINGRPTLTTDVKDGASSLRVPLKTPDPATLEIKGFEKGELVAGRKLEL